MKHGDWPAQHGCHQMRPGAPLTARASVQPAIWISVPKAFQSSTRCSRKRQRLLQERRNEGATRSIIRLLHPRGGETAIRRALFLARSIRRAGPGCRRTVVSRCPGVLATRCAQAQRRPRGQHPVLLRWLCQTGKGGAPGGSGHFHLDGGQEYSHFIGPWENFQVGLCHPSDPWGDGHISSSIALAMKVWFGHTAHSQSQHSYHPSIGAEN